jgi:hypothetical protein
VRSLNFFQGMPLASAARCVSLQNFEEFDTAPSAAVDNALPNIPI